MFKLWKTTFERNFEKKRIKVEKQLENESNFEKDTFSKGRACSSSRTWRTIGRIERTQQYQEMLE